MIWSHQDIPSATQLQCQHVAQDNRYSRSYWIEYLHPWCQKCLNCRLWPSGKLHQLILSPNLYLMAHICQPNRWEWASCTWGCFNVPITVFMCPQWQQWCSQRCWTAVPRCWEVSCTGQCSCSSVSCPALVTYSPGLLPSLSRIIRYYVLFSILHCCEAAHSYLGKFHLPVFCFLFFFYRGTTGCSTLATSSEPSPRENVTALRRLSGWGKKK